MRFQSGGHRVPLFEHVVSHTCGTEKNATFFFIKLPSHKKQTNKTLRPHWSIKIHTCSLHIPKEITPITAETKQKSKQTALLGNPSIADKKEQTRNEAK